MSKNKQIIKFYGALEKKERKKKEERRREEEKKITLDKVVLLFVY